MLFKNKDGRELELELGYSADEVEVLGGWYTDDETGKEDVTDEDIDYVLNAYADRIEEDALGTAIDDAYDLAMDR